MLMLRVLVKIFLLIQLIFVGIKYDILERDVWNMNIVLFYMGEIKFCEISG